MFACFLLPVTLLAVDLSLATDLIAPALTVLDASASCLGCESALFPVFLLFFHRLLGHGAWLFLPLGDFVSCSSAAHLIFPLSLPDITRFVVFEYVIEEWRSVEPRNS